MIPVAYACANRGGTDVSPPLSWSPGPAGTLSYAVVLSDKTNPLIHWVIYDIPASVTSLPENVAKVYAPGAPAGAKQTVSYAGTRGYAGPCPGTPHTYEFAVYAVDAAALPSATMATTRDQALVAILMHDLATVSLTGTFTPP